MFDHDKLDVYRLAIEYVAPRAPCSWSPVGSKQAPVNP